MVVATNREWLPTPSDKHGVTQTLGRDRRVSSAQHCLWHSAAQAVRPRLQIRTTWGLSLSSTLTMSSNTPATLSRRRPSIDIVDAKVAVDLATAQTYSENVFLFVPNLIG